MGETIIDVFPERYQVINSISVFFIFIYFVIYLKNTWAELTAHQMYA